MRFFFPMRHLIGVCAATAAVLACLTVAGANASSARRCSSASPNGYRTCVLAKYNITYSGTLTAMSSTRSESVTVSGRFRGMRADGEIQRGRIRGRRGLFTYLGFSSAFGKGSITSSVQFTRPTCTFSKTYQRTLNGDSSEEVDGYLILGWKPTAAELARNETGVGGIDFFLGDANFDPQVTGCPDYEGFTVSDMLDSIGAGKCGPEGYRRDCLTVNPFYIGYTMSAGAIKQTMRRLTRPANRLWAGKSFVLSGSARAPWTEEGSFIEVEAKITFTRIG